jgi:hypothetical protein
MALAGIGVPGGNGCAWGVQRDAVSAELAADRLPQLIDEAAKSQVNQHLDSIAVILDPAAHQQPERLAADLVEQPVDGSTAEDRSPGSQPRALHGRQSHVREGLPRSLLDFRGRGLELEPLLLGIHLGQHVHVQLGSLLADPADLVLPHSKAKSRPGDGYRNDRREERGN